MCQICFVRGHTGNNSSEGVFGSHLNAVCQICFVPGKTAATCPSQYLSQQSSVPVQAYATFNAVDANESVWYPDSAVASHMNPGEGNLLSTSAYNGTKCVRVGNGTFFPINMLVLLCFLPPLGPFPCVVSFMFLT